MDLGINGRCAVITGAAGAIALETAKILLADGCKLILSDVDEDELQEAVRELDGGDDVRAVVADLSSQEGADKIRDNAGGWHADILLHVEDDRREDRDDRVSAPSDPTPRNPDTSGRIAAGPAGAGPGPGLAWAGPGPGSGRASPGPGRARIRAGPRGVLI